MRRSFINALVNVAAGDERVFLLTGDLGFMALEPFAQAYPDRFINVGVAEQNMVGIATGLAESGFLPFVYSIATFAGLRPYEFIRNGPVSHNLPVRIVGVGGGFEYSHNGLSHFALEDIAVMRAQPALRVVAPADSLQAGRALEQTWNLTGPTYYRLGKDEALRVDGLEGRFDITGVQQIRSGMDCLLLSTGAVSVEAVNAATDLARCGIECAHAIVSRLNPAPSKALYALMKEFNVVVTVEAHYARGGLFSLACEVAGEYGLSCRIERRAVEQMPDGLTGDLSFMHEKNGLTAKAIAGTVQAAVENQRAACLTR